VKSLVVATDERDDKGEVVKSVVWLLLIRGDRSMNEVKVSKVPGLADFRFATLAEIDAHFACEPGYLGPVGLKQPLRIVADREVALMADWVCGANEPHFHIAGVNWGRDLPEPDVVADITGHPVGGVCPFGLAQPLPIYLDESLKAFDEVLPAAGSVNSAVRVSVALLADITQGQWVDVCRPAADAG
jgi:prolyl-tRNA editing enzyme YbaK/EbsC (Cys-tRNA(Pro) deacylase)